MHAPNTWEERPPRTPSVLASSFSLEVPVWLTSMFVHMAFILWLGTQWMPEVVKLKKQELQASIEPFEEEKTRVELKKQQFLIRPSELPNIGSVRTAGIEVDVSTALAVTESVELPRLPPQTNMLTDIRVPLERGRIEGWFRTTIIIDSSMAGLALGISRELWAATDI